MKNKYIYVISVMMLFFVVASVSALVGNITIYTPQGFIPYVINGTNVSFNYSIQNTTALNFCGYSVFPIIECYQEFPNVSTACGGVNTGRYVFSGAAGSILSVLKAFDGDWNTVSDAPATSVSVDIHYVKPSLANFVVWQIKREDETFINFTINHTSTCWTQNSSEIFFEIIFDHIGGTASTSCFNGVGYTVLSTYPSGIYEEAVYWGDIIQNISQITCTLNSSISPIGYNTVVLYANDSAGNYNYTISNFSIGITETNQTYNAITAELTNERFNITLIVNTSVYSGISATLFYNNTEHTSTVSTSGDYTTFIANALTPSVTSLTNFNFYWIITASNSTGSFYYNTSLKSQAVGNIDVDNCTTYNNVLINYTLRDERTQELLTGSNVTIEVELQLYPLGSDVAYINTSKTFNSSTARICINNNLNSSNYRLYSEARYGADNYYYRHHYIQNFPLSNGTIPQNIVLYDLQTTQGTAFLATYKGSTFLAVPNALIILNKKYIGEGVFKTVEIEKTDKSGQATLYLDLNTVTYTIVVSKEGENLTIFDNIAAFCQDKVTGDCKLNLYAVTQNENPVDYYNYQNLQYGATYNDTTRDVILTFSTIDGSVSTITVNTTSYDTTVNYCSAQVTSTSGSLTCSIPSSYNNVTFITTIYKDGYPIQTLTGTTTPKNVKVFGDNTAFLAFSVYIILPLMFITTPVGVLIGALIGTIISFIIFGLGGDMTTVGASWIGFMVAITIILLWKITRRDRE